MRWPRIVAGLDAFLAFDAERRVGAERVLVERRGKFEFPLDDGSRFTLTARADRIEILSGGGAALIDYKTGAPPGKREVEVGFAPQLTLEATMLAHGAFDGAPAVETNEALYFKLGGANGGEVKRLDFDDFSAVAARHFDGLKALLAQFADPATPYPPRLFPKFAKRRGRLRPSGAGQGMVGDRRPVRRSRRRTKHERAAAQYSAAGARAPAPGFRSRRLGLGLGQRRLGQDPCADPAGAAAAHRRRRALGPALSDLHQDRRRQYGGARVRDAGVVDRPRRRGA